MALVDLRRADEVFKGCLMLVKACLFRQHQKQMGRTIHIPTGNLD